MAYHGDNAVTAWIKYYSTTATLNDDYGFSSISDQGTGNFILSFSTTMSNSNYAVAAGGGGGTGSLSDGSIIGRISTGSFRQEWGNGGTYYDFNRCYAIVCGGF